VLLQAVAYALVWSMRRAPWSPLVDWPGVDLLALAAAPLLAFGSAWLTLAAVRTLGRQWSVEARLVEGHRLVTEGPYALVRHPIYSAMGGLLLATGLVQSQAWVLLPGIALFVVGTLLRTRAEEGLMREAFGPEFEAYARRVPALLPLPR
jgi:protein-S-isoprenylcysteine O-methyltransferase Ste14